MLNHGAVDAHTNHYGFGDNADWDSFTTVSYAAFIIVNAASAGNRGFLSKAADGTNGFRFGIDVDEKMYLIHYNGVFAGDVIANTGQSVGTRRSNIAVFTGANVNFFLDDVADGTPAYLVAVGASANDLITGQAAAGAAVSGAQYCVWKNYQLTAGNRAAYHAGTGVSPPQLADLVVWIRGNGEAAFEERKGVTGTETGTVTLTANAVDSYWISSGDFAIFIAEVLAPLFGAHLVNNAGLFGPGSFRERAKLIPEMSKRCVFDWQAHELRELMQAFERRPVYG